MSDDDLDTDCTEVHVVKSDGQVFVVVTINGDSSAYTAEQARQFGKTLLEGAEEAEKAGRN